MDLIFDQTSKKLARLPPQLAERFKILNRIHVDAGIAYRASPINAPLALFRTYSHDEAIFQGWQKLSRSGVTSTIVPGNTFSMLIPPHVSVLAERMIGLLRTAR